MPIDPVAVKSLVDLGFAVVFVTMVIAIGVGAIRGWWVPGWIYRRSEARADRVDAALLKLSDSFDSLADDVTWNQRDRHDVAQPPRRRGA